MTTGPDEPNAQDQAGAGDQTGATSAAAPGAWPAGPSSEPAAGGAAPAGEPTQPWEQASVPPPLVQPTPQPGVRYDVPQDQKNLAMLSTLGMLVVGFVSPLIVFAVTNGDPAKRFPNDHAKEGLNFSITLIVAGAVTALLSLLIIGFLLIPLLIGWSLWVIIAGTIQANNGEAPHYPLVPKILK